MRLPHSALFLACTVPVACWVTTSPSFAQTSPTTAPVATTSPGWSSRVVNSDDVTHLYRAGVIGSTSPSATTVSPSATIAPTTSAPKRNTAKKNVKIAVPVETVTSSASTVALVGVVAPVTDDVWAQLRQCESGGSYTINTGNGYYGAYQIAAGTWKRLGYAGLAHQAPREVQDEAARRIQASGGWGQWPACTRKLGLR